MSQVYPPPVVASRKLFLVYMNRLEEWRVGAGLLKHGVAFRVPRNMPASHTVSPVGQCTFRTCTSKWQASRRECKGFQAVHNERVLIGFANAPVNCIYICIQLDVCEHGYHCISRSRIWT